MQWRLATLCSVFRFDGPLFGHGQLGCPCLSNGNFANGIAARLISWDRGRLNRRVSAAIVPYSICHPKEPALRRQPNNIIPLRRLNIIAIRNIAIALAIHCGYTSHGPENIYSVPKKQHFREGALFTAQRAGFLTEQRLSCTEAAALFSESEGVYLVASEIAPVLPCPIRETLISIPSLMSPQRTAMRARRVRAYFRYLKAVRRGVMDQARAVAESNAHSGQWRARAATQVWLRGRIDWQLAMLTVYGFAYRAGINLNFQQRTAALSHLVSRLG